MALTFGFYNSIDHDRKYDAIQFGQIFDGIIRDGVYATYENAMIVKESSIDNRVIVQSGRAWFNHTWSYNDSDYSIVMPDPESFLDRIDAVVLDINTTNSYRKNTFQVVTGTPSDNPQKPSLIKESGHYQYPLCYVHRYGGVNHIYQRDITNSVGTEECPFVVGVLQGISIDDLIAQWQSQFTAWMSDEQNEFFAWMENNNKKYDNMLNHNSIAWNNWFSHIQYELDGDVAGHLQKQIDQIKKFAVIYVVDTTLFVPMSGASVIDKKLIFAQA